MNRRGIPFWWLLVPVVFGVCYATAVWFTEMLISIFRGN